MSEWPGGEPAAHFTVEPPPPSTNHLYGNHAGGRHKTAAYRAWVLAAGWHVSLQKPPSTLGCRHLAILIRGPLRIDIDNIKALLDLLSAGRSLSKGVRLGIIEDDRFVDDLRVIRTAPGTPLTVSIWRLP